MSERGELLPCPFCGGKPMEWIQNDHIIIGCHSCVVSLRRALVPPSGWEKVPPAARAAWNRRAPSPTTEGVEKAAEDKSSYYLDGPWVGSNVGFAWASKDYGPARLVRYGWQSRAAFVCSDKPREGAATLVFRRTPAGDYKLAAEAPGASASAPAGAPEPTPAALREWALALDRLPVHLMLGGYANGGYTHAGYLLRRIADAMEGR